MLSFFTHLSQSVLDLLYPPLCINCEASLEEGCRIFCQKCLKQLVPIDPQERCPYCFSFDFDVENEKCCHICLKNPPIIERTAAVFDYERPAATLIKTLKYGGQPYLAEGAGAYLAAQFIRLNWPMPDGIVPMPMSCLRYIERGYNQSLLLAKSVADLLNRPIYDVLKRRGSDFSQARLSHQQRLQLNSESFFLRKNVNLNDKCLLLIDDVMTTGSSLRCCAETLLELFPKKIYALTFCRAI